MPIVPMYFTFLIVASLYEIAVIIMNEERQNKKDNKLKYVNIFFEESIQNKKRAKTHEIIIINFCFRNIKSKRYFLIKIPKLKYPIQFSGLR